MFTGIVMAAAAVGGTGVFIGLLLGFAGKQFAVEVDEREVEVRDHLPGNNCGGCGYAGCDGLAVAIVSGTVTPDACPVAGAAMVAKIAGIMGMEIGECIRKVAFVRCGGSCEKANFDYEYDGVKDCSMMAFLPNGGAKTCNEGCLGFGSCINVCPFEALTVKNGLAVVDKEACKGCSKCVASCPQHLIDLIPYEQKTLVACKCTEKGKAVMTECEAGCISCMKCVKVCPESAIALVDNVARIDFEKCTNCGKCKDSCPRNCIA